MRQSLFFPLALALASAASAASAALDCSSGQSNNTVYNTTSGSYDILCQIDYGGGDLSSQGGLASFEDCIALCDATTNCIDVSYGPGGGNCWMKSSLGTPSTNTGIWTARSRLVGPQITCNSNESNGTIYEAADGGSYLIVCGVDYAGGDLTTTSEATFSDCMDACDATAGCIDVSYVAPSCYMKSSLQQPLTRSYVWTGKRVPKPVTTSSSTVTSTSTDGSSSTATGTDTTTDSGSVTDTASATGTGTDSGSVTDTASATGTATDSGSVTDTASATGTATDFGSVTATGTGTDSTTTTGTDTATDSGSVTATGSTSTDSQTSTTATSTSSSAVPTPTTPACVNGQSNMANFTTSAGSVYQIICDQEYYGGDLSLAGASTFEDCIDTCDFTSGCVDVSYVNGNCYMKSVLNSLVVADGVSTAKKVADTAWAAKPPLTCADGAANGTTYETAQGKFYEIFCAYDFPGGDLQGLSTSSFEDCLNACDVDADCIDLAYVAPSCYLKNNPNPPTPAGASVWAAKSVANPGCEAVPPTLYPVANTDIDPSSMASLVPSLNATLNYAEKAPGTKAVSLFLDMLYPQITLEDSSLVSVTCSAGNVVVDASTEEVQQYIMNNWPTSGLVLFTNSPGCNNATARGIYLTTGAFATMGSLNITFVVTTESFVTVASEVAIKYGTIKYDSDESTPSATQYVSTCSETGAASTAPPTATATAAPQTTLDANALNLYNKLKAVVQYSSDGNIILHPNNTQNVVLTPNPYDPTNTTEQAALESLFDQYGLSSPSQLGAQGTSGAQGVLSCSEPTNTATATTTTTRKARRSSSKPRRGGFFRNAWNSIVKRGGWDDFTNVACDDLTTSILGAFNEEAGDGLEAACGINDLAENGSALKCLFSSCETTTTIITYYTPPPATQYTFDYSWMITYPPLEQPVKSQGANKVLSCTNCGFSVSNIEFSGTIVINMTAGVIKQATITAGISGAGSMVVGLQSDGAWSGEWDYTYSNSELGTITLDSAFSIVPTVLYGIGINYNTDSAVSTSGGAQFNLNNAAVTMDLVSGNVLTQSNWAPSVSFTNPAFTTGTNIQLAPFMRWAVNLQVNIFGQIALSPTIASETVVGMDSSYSFSAQGSCPANNLLVTSYVSTQNMISNGMGTTKVLYSNQQYNSPKCYNVPSNQPSPADMAALSASGEAYCTSYIGYNAPTVYQWVTDSATVPSTSTAFTTTTITSTPVITIYPTTTISEYFTYTSTASTVYVSSTTNVAFPTQYLRKRDEAHAARITLAPVSTPADQQQDAISTASPANFRFNNKRQIAAPAVVSGWPASKISYACSQLATGKTTITSTVTSTTTSGSTVTTQTITANAQGPLSTITSSRTSYAYGGFSTATVPGPTTVTQYTCPLQTQAPAGSCIQVRLHGPWWIDGLLLGYGGDVSNPGPNPANPGQVWYLSCNGSLEAFIAGNTMWPLSGLPGEGYFLTLGDEYVPGSVPAVCAKDPAGTGVLNCNLPGDHAPGTMMVLPETYATEDGPGELDFRVYMPMWWSDFRGALPITLSYEEVECPCVGWD